MSDGTQPTPEPGGSNRQQVHPSLQIAALDVNVLKPLHIASTLDMINVFVGVVLGLFVILFGYGAIEPLRPARVQLYAVELVHKNEQDELATNITIPVLSLTDEITLGKLRDPNSDSPTIVRLVEVKDTANVTFATKALVIFYAITWTYYAWSYLAFLIYPLILAFSNPLKSRIHTPNSDMFYMLLVITTCIYMFTIPSQAYVGILIIFGIHRYKAFEIWSRILARAEGENLAEEILTSTSWRIRWQSSKRSLSILIREIRVFLWPWHRNTTQEHQSVKRAFGNGSAAYALFTIAEDWNKRYSIFVWGVAALAGLFLIALGISAFIGKPITAKDLLGVFRHEYTAQLISMISLTIATLILVWSLITTRNRRLFMYIEGVLDRSIPLREES